MSGRMSLDDRRLLAGRIREQMRDSAVVEIVYEPGDTTHYALVLSRLDSRSSSIVWASVFDDHPRSRLRVRSSHEQWVLSWPEIGSCVVDLSDGSIIWPTYIAEKLRCALGSAAVISELLALVLAAPDDYIAVMRGQFLTALWVES